MWENKKDKSNETTEKVWVSFKRMRIAYQLTNSHLLICKVWPDLAIYWTWATFKSFWQQLICPNLSYSSGIFCKGVKIYHFSSEIIFGQVLKTFGDFFLVTLIFVGPAATYKRHIFVENDQFLICQSLFCVFCC